MPEDRKELKILIGTPIHECKDYSMERWLENVAKLQKKTPADLLLIDNSPGLRFVEKVKRYLKKYKIKNYKIRHLEIHQEQEANERIGLSREIIRQYLLAHNYDAWFSWECDQIIPNNSLDKLIALMESGRHLMVCHGSPAREIPQENIASFGITLIKKEALKKRFLLREDSLKKQILQADGDYIEVYGIIKPIYHLNR